MTFVWPKSEEVTTFEELYKICCAEPIYEEVHQRPVSGEVSIR